jgi:hypothetical protein
MNKQRPSQRITLRQSKLLIRYQHLLHAVILFFCIAGTALNPITWIAVTIIFISWAYFSFLSKQQALIEQEVIWDSTGEWHVREGKGDYQRYPVLCSCFNSHWLTILGFKQSMLKRYYVLLLPDNCDADAWRRLRVRLKQELSLSNYRMPDSYLGSK